MNATQIIETIRAEAMNDQAVIDALNDGAALAALGITDADQNEVEEAISIMRGGAKGSAIAMKTYKRGRTSDEFKQAAIAAGLSVDDSQYQHGSDWLRFHGSLHGVKIDAIFNSINSRVIGTADGQQFSTDASLDGTPWFDAVLDLANTEY